MRIAALLLGGVILALASQVSCRGAETLLGPMEKLPALISFDTNSQSIRAATNAGNIPQQIPIPG
jgi:hypothetical protein